MAHRDGSMQGRDGKYSDNRFMGVIYLDILGYAIITRLQRTC